MKPIREGAGRMFSKSCMVALLCLGFAAIPAFAQPNYYDQPPPGVSEPPMVDLGPLMRRIDELTDSVGRLTGQIEELDHRIDELSQKNDRLQKQLDLQANAQSAPPPVAPPVPGPSPLDRPARDVPPLASIAPDNAAPTLRPYSPPPGVLGTLPAGGHAQDNGDPKRAFDSAMTLLSRAQYDSASQAFRGFVGSYPDDERAPMALYWTGDIAYSAKKDYDEAARDFAELLKKFPDSARAPEGMLKLGLSLFELGQMKEGCAAVAALPAKYPNAAAAISTRARTARRDNKCR